MSKERIVNFLNAMINLIEQDKIEVNSYTVDASSKKGEVKIEYDIAFEKQYKSQAEVYQDLCDLKLNHKACVRDANIYASKHTVKVWRNQYE